jgi:hypothetical protein
MPHDRPYLVDANGPSKPISDLDGTRDESAEQIARLRGAWFRRDPESREGVATLPAIASPKPLGWRLEGLGSWPAPLILATVALATRVQFFGNPIASTDEAFYLLVGDRMLHGALPYVTIWDRKPVGLFVLYAAMRSLGGDGVLAYQLVGTAVAVATALLIWAFAKPFTNRFGAMAAGVAYLIWLTLGSAWGGQAELFYALPVCGAAMITLSGLQEPHPRSIWLRGAIAMLLVGIAAQIKYNALFEGLFFGCCWLALGWRSGRRKMLGPLAVLWISAAVLPTAIALAYYAQRGELSAFWYANFVSIFHRQSPAPLVLAQNLAVIAIILTPLLAWVRPKRRFGDSHASTAYWFALCWLATSIAGVLAFGTYLEQYLLPILAPAAAAAAPTFGGGARMRTIAFLGAALLVGQAKQGVSQMAHGSRAQLHEIERRIDPRGPLFVYSGASALYRVSAAPIPTRFAFPSHLSRASERDAIGADPIQEIDRIMDARPETVVVRSPYADDENWPARALLYRHLRLDYRRAFHGRLGWQWVDVYRIVPAARFSPTLASSGSARRAAP